MIYEPREDSFLLQKYVRKLVRGRVLDMGTGSGIQALTALEKNNEILAVDIDKEVVESLKNKINVKISDLFSNVNGKFDFIIFNPPYLPNSEVKDIALDGGKEGYEVIEKFLDQANDYLNEDGKILMIVSSLSKFDKVKEIIKRNNFNFKILEEKKFAFEVLYVLVINRK